ncbi:MAG: hypothetical protein GY789_18630 [Hyphomicrobiales bacterium]|nr:hypothetical protein [Hyphomicrobiales bacterium]MCP5000225.1 hypothetical protein [Hyphomicrobiales bacterium]
MPVFTAPDGSPVAIDTEAVVRISRTVRSDLDGASCRIDWSRTDLVRESVPEVLELLVYELSSLVRLTATSNNPIWVNAKKVDGPFPPKPDVAQEGFGCHIVVSGEVQYVVEDENKVRQLFAHATGKV